MTFGMSGVEATGEGKPWSHKAGVVHGNGVRWYSSVLALDCTKVVCAVLMPEFLRRVCFSEPIGAPGVASNDEACRLPAPSAEAAEFFLSQH